MCNFDCKISCPMWAWLEWNDEIIVSMLFFFSIQCSLVCNEENYFLFSLVRHLFLFVASLFHLLATHSLHLRPFAHSFTRSYTLLTVRAPYNSNHKIILNCGIRFARCHWVASVHHRRYCIKHIQLIHWCTIVKHTAIFILYCPFNLLFFFFSCSVRSKLL